jgi:hypothetical protein
MAVYNLGQQQQEENPFAKAFTTGASLTLEAEGKKQLVRDSNYAEALKLVASKKLEQKEQTRKYLLDAYTNLWDKPQQQRDMFLQTDGGKQFEKLVKTELPELIDEDGKMIPMSSKDTIKQQIDNQIATVKQQVMEKGPDSINEGQRAILAMEGYKDIAAESMSILSKDPMFSMLVSSGEKKDLDQAQVMVTNTVNMLKRQRGGSNTTNQPKVNTGSLSNSLSTPVNAENGSTQYTNPQAGSKIKTFKRVK